MSKKNIATNDKIIRKAFMQRKDEHARRRPLCPVCKQDLGDEFWIPDEDWAKYVPRQYQDIKLGICKPCYEKFKKQNYGRK